MRNAIVKALSRDARILVMDEPTARLSPAERDRFMATIGSAIQVYEDIAATGQAPDRH